MPKTEPMTPEAFAYDLACSVSGCFEQVEIFGCRFNVEKARGIIKGQIAQRDRAILEAAAERVCDDCGCGCVEDFCITVRLILAPLEKEGS